MPATVTGVIKALLATPLPTVPVFRDNEGDGGAPTTGAWVVVHEGLSRTPTDGESPGRRRRRELVQVDVWQRRPPSTADDPSVALTVERTLDAARPTALSGGDGIARLRPEGYHRQYDEKAHLLVEQITVAVARHLT